MNSLIKLFIKDYKNVTDIKVREQYGVLSAAVGLAGNIFLAAVKTVAGIFSNSIAITADALNNLSDAGASFVTLISFKLSASKPDKEHPFGHGRTEYIAALITGLLIELMGFELIRLCGERILKPQTIKFSWLAVIIIIISMCTKALLCIFYNSNGKKINSPALSAAAKDSAGDIVATSVTFLGLIMSKFTSIPIDGYLGFAVAVFIMYSGAKVLKNASGMLIGEAPSKTLTKNLCEFIVQNKSVSGMHDLIVHSYGPGHIFASVHIELPSTMTLVEAHKIIDKIEKEVMEKFGIILVAHPDPIEIDSRLKERITLVAKEIDNRITVHDFRLEKKKDGEILSFDLVAPFNFKYNAEQINEIISNQIKETDKKLTVRAIVENPLT